MTEDRPLKTRLGPAQWRFLDRVCRSNGGGVLPGPDDTRVVLALSEKGLIQGKQGKPHIAVHTTDGLMRWRMGQ